jgi:tRNA modification GTPase
VIEVHLDLAGWPVTLLDTAGIRDSDDPVEREGVRRARDRAAAADLVLWVVDATAPASSAASGNESTAPAPRTWLIRNKIDAISANKRNEHQVGDINKNELRDQINEPLKGMVTKRLTQSSEGGFTNSELIFNLSATTGEGFEALLAALTRHAEGFLAGAEPALITRERHRRALEDALAALQRAGKPALAGREDLLAEELRIATRALGRLTGRVDVEDILDVIFRDFCIGK